MNSCTVKAEANSASAFVRVLAATVIAQQHNAHTKRIGSLQATARADPKTPGHLGDLGQAHFEYGSSGLLEASRADAEVKLALEKNLAG